MHAYQLQRQDKALEEATLYLKYMRLERKLHHDNKYSICVKKLIVEYVVLIYNTRCEKNMS